MIPTYEPTSCHSGRRAVRAVLLGLLALAVAFAPAAAGDPPTDPSAESELGEQGPKKHRKRQQRPVKMGTSGGNTDDFTVGGGFIECCSGTLGGLVSKAGKLFVLSNNHVLAKVNNARAGDDINQPGFLDTRCEAKASDFVAVLSGFKKLKMRGSNKVDAAIGEVVGGSVDGSGEVIGIGVPGNKPMNPTVGMRVKKSGRTTGVRTGVVDALNATVLVGYSEECSEDAKTFDIRFVKQFIVASTGKSFSAGGDSGSVIFEDVRTCPNPVGLLFAGNQQITVGNPMETVMSAVDKMKPKGAAEFVGCNQAAAGRETKALVAAAPGIGDRQLRLAKRVQARSESDLFDLEGVHAMGIGRSSSRPDAVAFKVYVDPSRVDSAYRMPGAIEGIPVEVVESAPVRALNCRKSFLVD